MSCFFPLAFTVLPFIDSSVLLPSRTSLSSSFLLGLSCCCCIWIYPLITSTDIPTHFISSPPISRCNILLRALPTLSLDLSSKPLTSPSLSLSCASVLIPLPSAFSPLLVSLFFAHLLQLFQAHATSNSRIIARTLIFYLAFPLYRLPDRKSVV